MQEIIDLVQQSGGRFERRQPNGSTVHVSNSAVCNHLQTLFVDSRVGGAGGAGGAARLEPTTSQEVAQAIEHAPSGDELEEFIDRMELASIESDTSSIHYAAHGVSAAAISQPHSDN